MKKQASTQSNEAEKIMVTTNRKARHDYEIFDVYEAGIVLVGTEVKSVFLGKADLRDSYCQVEKEELMIYGMYIAPYDKGGAFNVETRRTRKLLMHKREIKRIGARAQEKGFTLVPLEVYFKHGKVKIAFGVGRGRKLYDKREQIAKKDERREMERNSARQK